MPRPVPEVRAPTRHTFAMIQMPDRLEPPNPPLSDGVVTVRPFRPDDVAAVVAACQDPDIQRWIPLIPVPYTEADARRYVMMTLQAWHDGTSAEFAIVDAKTDRLLGSIGLHLGPSPRRHAIGYWVAPESRRQGVAIRAVRLVARWGFARIHAERLALWTLPGNMASQAVAERAGFRYEGLARNWELDRDDCPIDAVMYAMTPEDLADAEEADAAAAAARTKAEIAAAEGAAADFDAGAATPLAAAVPRELFAAGTRSAPYLDVAAVADLAPGTLRRVTLADHDLLVAWTADGIVVTDDRCPHMAAPLSIGGLDGNVVACPLHEGRFDLCSGETVQMPTTGGLDDEGRYHSPWSPTGAEMKPEPPTKKMEARRLTRVRKLRYYPVRFRDGRLEAKLPILPE
jgi:RimJ/RimL family protein N-acetyltransferase/nitrite reductase/ring-hydroxylating ferredoxin subunit